MLSLELKKQEKGENKKKLSLGEGPSRQCLWKRFSVELSFCLFSFRFLKEIEDFLQKQPMGHPHILPAAQFIIKLNTFN